MNLEPTPLPKHRYLVAFLFAVVAALVGGGLFFATMSATKSVDTPRPRGSNPLAPASAPVVGPKAPAR